MADSERPGTPAKATSGARPESPTTARPLDFDDEPSETPTSTITPTAPHSAPAEEAAPPPKPPRPLSPRQQAENTLKEAFPSIDTSVVTAVLTASGGQVEPAFNALLGMTDPDSQQEPPPPAKPPRPARGPTAATSTAQSQLEADEMYARQLAEHYSGAGGRQSRRDDPDGPRRRKGSNQEERERSFIDDDLPVIRENIRKGFLETQSTVNKWVANFKKKLDGEDDEDFENQPARPAQGYQSYGRRSGDLARRSADRERYDADPQVLGDDFSRLEMRDTEAAEERSRRPLANPDLFKPTPPAPTGRKVSFQAGPPEEIGDLYSGSPDPTKRPASSGSKSSKWQPLATVDPSPVADNDPFSLGDSDDDKESKSKDPNADESDRLKEATAEAMAGEIGGDKATDGAKDKPADVKS